MTSSASEVHLSEPGACLCSGSVLGKMISVKAPDEQLLPVWVRHEALLTTSSYKKHFADVKQIAKRNRLKKKPYLFILPGGKISCSRTLKWWGR